MSDNVKIHIGTPQEMGRRFVDAWHRAERGEIVDETNITFRDLEILLATLTPKRLHLLRYVRHHEVRNVRVLAAGLRRNYKNVHKDVEEQSWDSYAAPRNKLSLPMPRLMPALCFKAEFRTDKNDPDRRFSYCENFFLRGRKSGQDDGRRLGREDRACVGTPAWTYTATQKRGLGPSLLETVPGSGILSWHEHAYSRRDHTPEPARTTGPNQRAMGQPKRCRNQSNSGAGG